MANICSNVTFLGILLFILWNSLIMSFFFFFREQHSLEPTTPTGFGTNSLDVRLNKQLYKLIDSRQTELYDTLSKELKELLTDNQDQIVSIVDKKLSKVLEKTPQEFSKDQHLTQKDTQKNYNTQPKKTNDDVSLTLKSNAINSHKLQSLSVWTKELWMSDGLSLSALNYPTAWPTKQFSPLSFEGVTVDSQPGSEEGDVQNQRLKIFSSRLKQFVQANNPRVLKKIPIPAKASFWSPKSSSQNPTTLVTILARRTEAVGEPYGLAHEASILNNLDLFLTYDLPKVIIVEEKYFDFAIQNYVEQKMRSKQAGDLSKTIFLLVSSSDLLSRPTITEGIVTTAVLPKLLLVRSVSRWNPFKSGAFLYMDLVGVNETSKYLCRPSQLQVDDLAALVSAKQLVINYFEADVAHPYTGKIFGTSQPGLELVAGIYEMIIRESEAKASAIHTDMISSEVDIWETFVELTKDIPGIVSVYIGNCEQLLRGGILPAKTTEANTLTTYGYNLRGLSCEANEEGKPTCFLEDTQATREKCPDYVTPDWLSLAKHDARCHLNNKEYYCTVGCQEGNSHAPWFVWKISDCLRIRRDLLTNPSRKARQWMRYHQCPYIPETIPYDSWELTQWSENPYKALPCTTNLEENLSTSSTCPFEKLDVAIGLVVHDEAASLNQTLNSLAKGGLFQCAKEVVIWANKRNGNIDKFFDHWTKSPYNVKVLGDSKNYGLTNAINWLVGNVSSKFFLLLEKDFNLVETSSCVQNHISTGIKLLDSNAAHVVRYRSRRRPGRPLWGEKIYGGFEEGIFEDGNQINILCDFYHWLDNPTEAMRRKYQWSKNNWRLSNGAKEIIGERGEEIFKLCHRDPDYWCVKCELCAWTNNPQLWRTEWYLDEYVRKRFENWKHYNPSDNLEMYMNWDPEAWKGWTVALGDGLFKHVDRDNFMGTYSPIDFSVLRK